MNRWNEKRYYSLDYYLRKTFGEKVYKIALSIADTCPNRDGTIGTGGCIFCSRGGSGDFAGDISLPVSKQLEKGKQELKRKYSGGKYVAYFQSFTSTYVPIEKLRSSLFEAAYDEDVVAVSVATRPDCLGEDVLQVIKEVNDIKPVWVELGLQTIHEATAVAIRRGYDLECFQLSLDRLGSLGVKLIVHVIIGLMGEDEDMILQTIDYLSEKHVDGVKLQLLHILKGTDLEEMYLENKVSPLEFNEYTDIVVSCLEHLSKDIVVHRITGDGNKNELIEPKWSLDKKRVLNEINHKLKSRDTYQGRLCPGDNND